MKKAIVLLILLLAACKRTETTNETTTTMTATESSATVATVAPTDTTPTTATAAIQTMGTNPAAKPETKTPPAKPATTTTATAPSTDAPSPAPAPATAAIETMGTNPNPPPSTPPPTITSEGMSVFKSHGCAMCHGAAGAGDTIMGTKNNIRDFHSAAVQSQTDEQLIKTIREGKGPVSASAHKSKALTADQAKAVIAWIRSLK